ncbi:hypothetical protein CBR_g3415 [Chara braunii]|uniref:Myb-like domain-containing protein n=1 Tax=Chara braunii TaxID=69332 RepID=A0A388JQW2_CHABU|nr:hypothetical protein CBR_g3415 [Chara braunii]|eukprot:GBG60171.1 hypothetical protein CBR_g3415 [Chara braunii]
MSAPCFSMHSVIASKVCCRMLFLFPKPRGLPVIVSTEPRVDPSSSSSCPATPSPSPTDSGSAVGVDGRRTPPEAPVPATFFGLMVWFIPVDPSILSYTAPPAVVASRWTPQSCRTRRLRVGDQAKETDEPHAEPSSEDDEDVNDGKVGEGEGGYVSPFRQSDMVGKGGKSKPSNRKGRPWVKKGKGKASDDDGDDDAEEKRNFWSVEHIIALIRAKRDQDAHMQGMGHAYARTKPREWKWQDVAQRLKNVGVHRKAEKCGKNWDNLMQQFKKVYHFQSPSGGQDFFQLTGKERANKGFDFNMDRAVYDKIEGSTGMNHTINPKNVAGTGSRLHAPPDGFLSTRTKLASLFRPHLPPVAILTNVIQVCPAVDATATAACHGGRRRQTRRRLHPLGAILGARGRRGRSCLLRRVGIRTTRMTGASRLQRAVDSRDLPTVIVGVGVDDDCARLSCHPPGGQTERKVDVAISFVAAQ